MLDFGFAAKARRSLAVAASGGIVTSGLAQRVRKMTAGEACCSETPGARSARAARVSQALRLSYLTVGWNLIEGAVAVTAAVVAGSIALFGFGADSFVESASGAIMIWRLRAEQRHRLSDHELDALEHRARRLVAVSLFLLGAYIAIDATLALWRGERPGFSAVGVALTSISLVVMIWLARAKRRIAGEINSRALEADAFQTTACWWLSLAALFGIGLNGLFGWWWADPVAALIIVALIVKEGRDAWRGEPDCC